MIVMTLNCRGLASNPNKLAVQRLIEEKAIDVLFLQETMSDGSILVSELEVMFKEWKFVSVDAKGKSRGLLLGWKFRQFHLLNVWVVCSGLCVKIFSLEIKLDLCFINLYGPYGDRELFWNNFLRWIVYFVTILSLEGI